MHYKYVDCSVETMAHECNLDYFRLLKTKVAKHF
jgi:hypothetical protein